MIIKLSTLKKDGLQTRVALNEQTVADYTESIRGGAKFPPVTVIREGRVYWLADGFHRVEATSRAGIVNIEANVTDGTFADALRIALGANANHGLRRTNADKRRALEIAWENREMLFGGEPTGGALARVCAVSVATGDRFVSEFSRPSKMDVPEVPRRAKPTAEQDEETTETAPKPPVARRVGADGKTYAVPPPKRGKAVSERPAATHPKHAPGVIVDRFGVEVPTAIRGAFTDVTVDEVAHHVSEARSIIRRMKEAGNPAYRQISDSALIELDNAWREVRFSKPYCVCRMCQGDGCRACKETGFQTESQYDKNPKERKAE